MKYIFKLTIILITFTLVSYDQRYLLNKQFIKPEQATLATRKPGPPLSRSALDRLAENITIEIVTPSYLSQGGITPLGSGVIIGRNRDTYYVLTARHLFDYQDYGYRIIIRSKRPGEDLEVVLLDILYFYPDADLAVVAFASRRQYTVAKIGEPSELKKDSQVYIGGWPGVDNRDGFQFTPAKVTNPRAKDGDSLAYEPTEAGEDVYPGMSGGPVLNEEGHLMGIHVGLMELDGDGEGVLVSAFLREIREIREDVDKALVRVTPDVVSAPPRGKGDVGLRRQRAAERRKREEAERRQREKMVEERRKREEAERRSQELEAEREKELEEAEGRAKEEREAERRQREQLEAERRKREEAERRSQQLEAEREKERQEAEQRAKNERAAELQRQRDQERRQEQEVILQQKGILSDGDLVLPSDESVYDEHTFEGTGGQVVFITLESPSFDTYLAVFSPTDELLEENDDVDKNNKNSQLTITLPITGKYRVIVNSYDKTGRGEYDLRAIQSGAPTGRTARTRAVENEISLASARGVDYRKLRDLLAAGRWREADLETDRVILKAARRYSEGYLRRSDAENFSCQDLRTIDKLWVKYSNGNFGFSVQKQIYQSLGGTKEFDYEVWRKFGDKVGWRKGGRWLFSEYTLERGHLPTSAGMYGGGLESILLGDWMNSSFLVWRPVDCNI